MSGTGPVCPRARLSGPVCHMAHSVSVYRALWHTGPDTAARKPIVTLRDMSLSQRCGPETAIRGMPGLRPGHGSDQAANVAGPTPTWLPQVMTGGNSGARLALLAMSWLRSAMVSRQDEG
jgi:hypothetical protein